MIKVLRTTNAILLLKILAVIRIPVNIFQGRQLKFVRIVSSIGLEPNTHQGFTGQYYDNKVNKNNNEITFAVTILQTVYQYS